MQHLCQGQTARQQTLVLEIEDPDVTVQTGHESINYLPPLPVSAAAWPGVPLVPALPASKALSGLYLAHPQPSVQVIAQGHNPLAPQSTGVDAVVGASIRTLACSNQSVCFVVAEFLTYIRY